MGRAARISQHSTAKLSTRNAGSRAFHPSSSTTGRRARPPLPLIRKKRPVKTYLSGQQHCFKMCSISRHPRTRGKEKKNKKQRNSKKDSGTGNFPEQGIKKLLDTIVKEGLDVNFKEVSTTQVVSPIFLEDTWDNGKNSFS